MHTLLHPQCFLPIIFPYLSISQSFKTIGATTHPASPVGLASYTASSMRTRSSTASTLAGSPYFRMYSCGTDKSGTSISGTAMGQAVQVLAIATGLK